MFKKILCQSRSLALKNTGLTDHLTSINCSALQFPRAQKSATIQSCVWTEESEIDAVHKDKQVTFKG